MKSKKMNKIYIKYQFCSCYNLKNKNLMEEEKLDYFKYKSIIFYLFILGLLWAIIGVTYFRNAYYIFACVAITYNILKYTQMSIILAYISYRFHKNLTNFR